MDNLRSFIDWQQQKIEGILGDVYDKKSAISAAASDLKMIPPTFQTESQFEIKADSNSDNTTTNSEMIINNNIAPVINPPKQKGGSLTHRISIYFPIIFPFISKEKRMYGISKL